MNISRATGIGSICMAIAALFASRLYTFVNGGERWNNNHGGIGFIFFAVPAMLMCFVGIALGIMAVRQDEVKWIGSVGLIFNLAVFAFILWIGGFDFFSDIFHGRV